MKPTAIDEIFLKYDYDEMNCVRIAEEILGVDFGLPSNVNSMKRLQVFMSRNPNFVENVIENKKIKKMRANAKKAGDVWFVNGRVITEYGIADGPQLAVVHENGLPHFHTQRGMAVGVISDDAEIIRGRKE